WHVRKFVVEHEDANDIVQNTFVKAFRGIGRFKGKSKIYTWLYKIASNEAITWVNQKKRKQTSSLDEDGFGIANQLHADAFFDGNQAQLLLQQALGALPEKQRLVFNMKYFDEMTYQEMSEILDTSVGALKASYHHAVKKIERFFKDIEV
ncbi:MAG: RNA polymerase sigma factor, partial [Saprospiraceae bacterium]|nr:RNA polymerase sigma factor [Saprospiraceae bacterium]